MKKLIGLLCLMILGGCYYTGPGLGLDRGIWLNGDPPATINISIAWPWESTEVYSDGDYVTMPQFIDGGPIYVSLKDNNVGIWPPSVVVDGHGPYGGFHAPDPDWQTWWAYYGEQ